MLFPIVYEVTFIFYFVGWIYTKVLNNLKIWFSLNNEKYNESRDKILC